MAVWQLVAIQYLSAPFLALCLRGDGMDVGLFTSSLSSGEGLVFIGPRGAAGQWAGGDGWCHLLSCLPTQETLRPVGPLMGVLNMSRVDFFFKWQCLCRLFSSMSLVEFKKWLCPMSLHF